MSWKLMGLLLIVIDNPSRKCNDIFFEITTILKPGIVKLDWCPYPYKAI